MNLDRLINLKVENDLKGLDMEGEAERFSKLASRKENGTAPAVVSAFNLFQTPGEIAGRMAALVAKHVGDGARILEPSAGLGRLFAPLQACLGAAADFVLVEESRDCCRELYRLTESAGNVALKQGDFLQQSRVSLGGEFDAVVMNPPFKMWRDIKHIKHALSMLRPGGLLVALCANGPRQNEELRPLADTWEVLPAGSFRSEGTGVSVAMLTIRA